MGLKPGQEELVFNRFWRADSSRKRHSGGTGLGLAIAREDAVLHGGTLDATGYEGFGSRFRLIIPRTPNAEVGEAPIAVEIPGAPVTSTADGSELAEPNAEAPEAQDTGAAALDAGAAFATPAISVGMSSPHVDKSEKGTDGEAEGDGILWPSELSLIHI